MQDQIVCFYLDLVLKFWHMKKNKETSFPKVIFLENARNLVISLAIKLQFSAFRWLIKTDLMRTTVTSMSSNYLSNLFMSRNKQVERKDLRLFFPLILLVFMKLERSWNQEVSMQTPEHLMWNYLRVSFCNIFSFFETLMLHQQDFMFKPFVTLARKSLVLRSLRYHIQF